MHPLLQENKNLIFHLGPTATQVTDISSFLHLGHISIKAYIAYVTAVVCFSAAVFFYGTRLLLEEGFYWAEFFGNLSYLTGFVIFAVTIIAWFVDTVPLPSHAVSARICLKLLGLLLAAITVCGFARFCLLLLHKDKEHAFKQRESALLAQLSERTGAMTQDTL